MAPLLLISHGIAVQQLYQPLGAQLLRQNVKAAEDAGYGRFVMAKHRECLLVIGYFICSVIIIGSILGVQASEAATYYVAVNGNDGNSCSQAQNSSSPKKRVNAGLGCLSAGDTLIVKAGTYGEWINQAIPSGISTGQPTTVRAETPFSVTLRPPYSVPLDLAAVVQFGSKKYIHFEGFRIDGSDLPVNTTDPETVEIKGMFVDHSVGAGASYITVKNVEITNMTQSCMAVGGSHITLSNLKLSNCRLNVSTATTPTAHAIYWRTQNSILENTVMKDVDGNCISMYPGYEGGSGIDNNIIRNNILSNCGWYGIYNGSGTNNKIYNNVFYRNEAGGFHQGDGGDTIRNNIMYLNGGDGDFHDFTGTNVVSHNLIGVNPLFVNPSGGDFHLQSGSPAINAGVSLSEVPQDFEGTVRPQGSAYDIGAFEYRESGNHLKSPANLRIVQR